MSRRLGFVALALVLGAALTAGLAEGVARVYVYFIAEQGKLFRPDSALGWTLIPNLDIRRRNPAGETWHIETTDGGFRSEADAFRPDAERRILILGDSFAFGEGVELADRFDTLLSGHHPEWSFVNQGVMGYGPDQELIAARSTIRGLGEGDVIVLVTFLNDFIDLLRKSHSGRSKPWFEIRNGELIEHSPELGLAQRLRDQSYLLARIFREVSPDPTAVPESALRVSSHVYRRLVAHETEDAVARGVRVLIAYHGGGNAKTRSHPELEASALSALRRSCEAPGFSCLSIDRGFAASGERGFFQRDGHWNATGNTVVADLLASRLAGLSAPDSSD